jgi:hypothetical protein
MRSMVEGNPASVPFPSTTTLRVAVPLPRSGEELLT